jgi:hypothetical protein
MLAGLSLAVADLHRQAGEVLIRGGIADATTRPSAPSSMSSKVWSSRDPRRRPPAC